MFGRDWKLIRQKNNEIYRRKTGEKKASVRFLKYIEYLQAKYKDNQGWRGNLLERVNNILCIHLSHLNFRPQTLRKSNFIYKFTRQHFFLLAMATKKVASWRTVTAKREARGP